MGYGPHRPFGKPSRLETFSKNALIILNIIFFVFGFILFIYGCGGKTSTNRESYVAITENGGDIFMFTSKVLVILGAILLMIGFWGLFGIHTWLKASVYMSLLILLAVMDITVGLYSNRMEANAKVTVENNLISTLQRLKINQDPTDPVIIPVRNSWDALQSELKCCGIYDYRDWFYSSPVAHRRIDPAGGGDKEEIVNMTEHKSHSSVGSPDGEDFMSIPHSCFKNGDDGLAEEDFNTPISTDSIMENVYSDGCLKKTVTDLDIDRMQRVGILMAVSKIFAVICASILTWHLRHDKILVPTHA